MSKVRSVEHASDVFVGMIQTYTGRLFSLETPDSSQVNIRDIARALSCLCRFGGHVRHFYSVAQHCLLMARRFRSESKIEEAKWALLHDAAEAYVMDMPRPIKYMGEMSHYRTIEHRVQKAIFEKFGLVGSYPPIIKELDKKIVLSEAKTLLSQFNHPEWIELKKLGWEKIPIRPLLSPAQAERAYLREFKLLFGDKYEN
jgi:uncharacterized protein